MMDTEAIASEIVRIRNRLDEMDAQTEDASGTDVDEERSRLEKRLLLLQDRLSAHGTGEPDMPDNVQYVPPA